MKYLQKFLLTLLFISTLNSCNQKNGLKSFEDNSESKFNPSQQDSLIEIYLKNGAWKNNPYSQEWQEEINKGLKVDSTVAYLWQQKAMPLFKQSKYELGMPFIDQAVKYNPKKWQDYRAFIKCIFSKEYEEAIKDFKNYQEKYGYGFVMDHSYNFYIALSYLQLNKFEKAEKLFEKDYKKTVQENGKGWLHHLDLFYYGISKYEQKKYKEALELFDQALEIYPQFSDVQYYKARTLYKLGRPEEGENVYIKAKENAKQGYSINEDNAIYERYPYQVRWP
ncbi:tetratricopeptide repeat protein [Christiangramia sabulilitoris]|uniref:Tetratricopeptide repeat protein n=1 Tax=Christiangramia sabulilitoris TaxID=2583991 RepID=A0A550I775_9FLAO|nr:tetratricopeptide repeat protein [Christiangramia sabulilitoris]TRO66822.1 tetratricopeptide repeat protein [Christiangramia sabulilitoris]